MNIALLGIGTVGSCVRMHLEQRDDITIRKILVRRDRPDLGDLAEFSFDAILNDPEIDTIVEVMGGLHPAYDYVLRSLKAGKNVATANKLLLSYHFEDLFSAARESGAHLKIDASVGGGIPFLFNLMRSKRADKITALTGIVNGTTNLILDTMQTDGSDLASALAQAQLAGFAEADPSDDIDGIDARSKLCVSASVALGKFVNPEDISTLGIKNIAETDIRLFRQSGYVCRLLIHAQRIDDDHISAFVEPTLVLPSDMEANVHRCDNLVGLVGEYSGMQYFFGQGKGNDPTAFAVVSGLVDILDDIRLLENNPPVGHFRVDNTQITHRYYVRTTSQPNIPVEKTLSSGCYITAPISVDSMHRLAHSLQKIDPDLFIAGIRG